MKNNYSNWLSYVHKNKYHRWDVRVWINDKLNYFGLYESKDDAVRVAKEAELKLLKSIHPKAFEYLNKFKGDFLNISEFRQKAIHKLN